MKPYYENENGRLYHGDCLEILPQLEPVDLVLTDPPYGMNNNVDSGRFSGGSQFNGRKGGSNEGRFKDRIIGDDKNFDPHPLLTSNKIHKTTLILFGINHYINRLFPGTLLIWIKKYDDAFGTFLSDAEVAWMSKGCGVYCFRDITFRATARDRSHPNEKPIPLMSWCIEKSKTSGIVADPYIGSGTTAVACERLKRKWIGIEIEEKYCEIAVKRIEHEREQLKLF